MCCCNHESVDLSLLKDVLDKYADVKGSLISILQKTQEIYGYVPIDAVYHISERTGLTPAKIMGVATFYSQFRFTAVGKYLIMVCKGTACYVNGAERIIDAISEELGIGNNETTADGLFSLSIVSCLGCCSLAPVMMINEDTYGSLTPDKVKTILRDIRAKEGKYYEHSYCSWPGFLRPRRRRRCRLFRSGRKDLFRQPLHHRLYRYLLLRAHC